MTGQAIVWTLIKIVVMVFVAINLAGILTWAERRQSAMIQHRIGPNRAVIKIFGKELRVFGLLHTAADGVKMLFKEDFLPPKADRLLFSLAPMLVVFAVLTLLAVVPFGDTLCPQDIVRKVTKDGAEMTIWPAVPRYGSCSFDPRTGSFPVDLQILPIQAGLLFYFAMAGQGIIGAAIAGWSSDNKFSLMGALRAASQMVSYEVTLGMSLIGAFMIYQTVRLDDMVRWQGENTWGIFVQPLAFFLFFTAAVAESKRIPFDLPEAESELVTAYFTEYSGMKFGMFMLAEFIEIVTSSMLIVTIFLGGWSLPFFHRDGLTIEFGATQLFHLKIPHIWMTIIGILTFFGKLVVVCWVQMFVRWSLPRFRYDQLMKLGWKILLPASLANILVTGVVYLALAQGGAQVSDALAVAADVSQAIIAVAITYWIVRGTVGFFTPRSKKRDIIGSAAKLAEKLGGSKPSPMQA